MTVDPLAPLVDRIARSDADALRALYERSSAIAYGLILSIVREEDAAEEALVDVYTQVWRQAGRYDPRRGSVASWIATLARTRAIDLRRARIRRLDRETELPEHPMLDESPGPSERSQHYEEAARVRAALDALPLEQRRALEATFFSGWSNSEIAREFGRPLGTVKTRIRSGLAAMRRQLVTSQGEVAMIRHAFLDDDLRDRAIEYVLGTLEDGESHAVGLHLPQCEVCRRYVDEIRALAGEIVLAGPRRAPPLRAWERIAERIGAAEAASPISRAIGARAIGSRAIAGAPQPGPDFSFVGSDEHGWTPTSVPGVEVRRLSVDVENDRMTFLARMAPGASYPSHRHGGPEECYVLEGDLDVGHRRLRAGDFERAEPGSVHPRETTEEGCLLLIVSSLQDEMLG